MKQCSTARCHTQYSHMKHRSTARCHTQYSHMKHRRTARCHTQYSHMKHRSTARCHMQYSHTKTRNTVAVLGVRCHKHYSHMNHLSSATCSYWPCLFFICVPVLLQLSKYMFRAIHSRTFHLTATFKKLLKNLRSAKTCLHLFCAS